MSEVTLYRRVCCVIDCCGGRPLDEYHNENCNGNAGRCETDIFYRHSDSLK